MPDTQVLPDINASRGEDLAPAFVCDSAPAFVGSRTDGGLDGALVRVAGELDIATAPQLERTLDESQLRAQLVVLDLRELTFIDCCGVHVIVNANHRARRDGRRLVLLRGSPAVDRMLTLTGCSDQLEIGDLDPGEPPVLVLRQLAERERAR